MPKVHGVALSPFVRKVLVGLEEKSIPYENVPVVPFGMSDEFKKISPAEKIPVYQDDDGHTVPDSSVILAYLERQHPEPALYPSDPREYAAALFLEEYADTKLIEATTPIFFERFVAPQFFQREPDELRIAEAAELQAKAFAYLQDVVAGRAFAVGDAFSVADIAIASPFVGLEIAGAPLDAERWPALATYLSAILARPSFAKVIAESLPS